MFCAPQFKKRQGTTGEDPLEGYKVDQRPGASPYWGKAERPRTEAGDQKNERGLYKYVKGES